jgi:zinc protease
MAPFLGRCMAAMLATVLLGNISLPWSISGAYGLSGNTSNQSPNQTANRAVNSQGKTDTETISTTVSLGENFGQNTLVTGDPTALTGRSTPSLEVATSPLPPKIPQTPPAETASNLTQNVRKTVLSNGLTILTKEVKTAPVVSVQIWYRVGSRDEVPGITGISHQLEHLMFKGTKQRPIQFGRLLSALGSSSNAFTSYDMTAYFGTVGSDKLNAMLELEADRMVNTLAGEAQLKSERTVVLSELDGGNNNPGTRLYRAVMGAAFAGNSYGWPVIGYRSDVENYTAAEVQAYYQKFYRPDNATLVIVGNFDTDSTLAKVQNTFGKIQAPPKPDSIKPQGKKPAPPQPIKDRPIVLKEPGSVAFLQMVYPNLPKAGHPDNPALEVMDMILTTGRSSRVYQSLVESGIASSAGGDVSNFIGAGWYMLSGTPAAGRTNAELEKLLLAEVTKIQTQPVTAAELERAKVNLRSTYILSNRDISSQASQLGYNQTVQGDYRYSDAYLKSVSQVTAADVQRVAKTYLLPEKRVTGFFEPTVITQGGSTSNTTPNHGDAFRPSEPVDPAEVAKYLPQDALAEAKPLPSSRLPEKTTLDNGITLLLLPDSSSPSVSLSGHLKAGSVFDSFAKSGLAGLTAQNVTNGTKGKTALELAQNLENRGVRLSLGAGRENVSISGVALSQELPLMVEHLADLLQNATFPNQEFEVSRRRNLVSLKNELDSPGALARRVFQSTLYPKEHPFASLRTKESLTAIQRQDLIDFYRKYYRPDTLTLAITGDFDPNQLKALLNKTLGKWKGTGPKPDLKLVNAPTPAKLTQLEKPLPGKTQAVTLMGIPSINRLDKRFYAALVLNQVIGGDTLSSRLGAEIRDRKGLTYGIYSTFSMSKSVGNFVVQMQTSGKDTKRAVEATLELLRDVQKNGITANELAFAKRSLINSFPVELAEPDSILESAMSDELYGLPKGDFYQFPQRVRSVTLADVNQAAKELIKPDQFLVVSVVPQ